MPRGEDIHLTSLHCENDVHDTCIEEPGKSKSTHCISGRARGDPESDARRQEDTSFFEGFANTPPGTEQVAMVHTELEGGDRATAASLDLLLEMITWTANFLKAGTFSEPALVTFGDRRRNLREELLVLVRSPLAVPGSASRHFWHFIRIDGT